MSLLITNVLLPEEEKFIKLPNVFLEGVFAQAKVENDRTVNEELNITFKGTSIPFEDYLNVSKVGGKIKFETLDNKFCILELEYEKKNILDVVNQKINITKRVGGYYFTTDVGVEVNSMAYKMNCSDFKIRFDENRSVFLMDNIKIDFNEAKDKQNISTTYDNQTQKLIFLPDKDEFGNDKKADLRFIDPDITVDSSVENALNLIAQPRSLVWINSTTGYIFFADGGIDLHYRKTTDSGATWATEVNIKTGTVVKFVIWYDKWTKDDTGDVIHIAFVDRISDDILYNSFSTSDDTLDGELIVFNGASASGIGWQNGGISIVKARGGNIYVGGWIDNNGENGFFRATDSPATSFTARTDTGFIEGIEVDRIMFLAGNEADSNDIWSIYQDVSANEMTLKVYDNSANTWNESSVIDSIDETSIFFGFDSMDRHSDGHAILVLWNEQRSATGDLAVHDITNITTFSEKTDVVSNSDVFGIVGLLINQQNDDLYVDYNDGLNPGQIVYQKSTDGGGSWDGELAMSVTEDNHRLVMGGTSVGDDGGRWMPVWFNDDINALLTNFDNAINISAVSGDTFPQWFDNSSNDTVVSSNVLHSVRWTDDIALSGHIFSFDNGNGTLNNDSFVLMTGVSNHSNVTKIINSTVGSTIRWRVYANDSTNQLNATDIFSYDTTDVDSCTFSTSPWNIELADNCVITDTQGSETAKVNVNGTGSLTIDGGLIICNSFNFMPDFSGDIFSRINGGNYACVK